MNAPATTEQFAAQAIPTTAGTVYKGCIYVDRILIVNKIHALFLLPKAARDKIGPRAWHDSYSAVPGAQSPVDGAANTRAMAEAGSYLAKDVLAIEHEGLNDFFIAALDQAERIYRALKPTADKNSQWMRSGINLHSLPPAQPYTADHPEQTDLEAFRAGADEAIKARTHWTSTQHAGWADGAWAQDFDVGDQLSWLKDAEFPALVVRSEVIE